MLSRACLGEDRPWLPQVPDPGSGLGHIVTIFPKSEERLVLRLWRSFFRRGSDGLQFGPLFSAIEDRNRFAAVNSAENFLHAVAEIDNRCVHRMSTYEYTSGGRDNREFSVTGSSAPDCGRRLRGYPLRRRASNIFPGEALPHLAPIIFDFFGRQRNPEIGPESFNAAPRFLCTRLLAQAGGKVQDLLLLFGRATPEPLPEWPAPATFTPPAPKYPPATGSLPPPQSRSR